jgi:hypothetical protein
MRSPVCSATLSMKLLAAERDDRGHTVEAEVDQRQSDEQDHQYEQRDDRCPEAYPEPLPANRHRDSPGFESRARPKAALAPLAEAMRHSLSDRAPSGAENRLAVAPAIYDSRRNVRFRNGLRWHFTDACPVVRSGGLNGRKIEMASTADLAALSIGDFTPHLDATFDMQTAGGVVPLKLVKADLVGDSGRAGGAFSLIFVAPKGLWHQQAIYPINHPALGVMEIFLVPVGPAFGGDTYQAIFT